VLVESPSNIQLYKYITIRTIKLHNIFTIQSILNTYTLFSISFFYNFKSGIANLIHIIQVIILVTYIIFIYFNIEKKIVL